jgi:2'-hydroxyisoflavone reductase
VRLEAPRALILGGTAFLGIALRESLQRQGYAITLFNRGLTDSSTPDGMRVVRGDRTRGFDALDGETFDAVIDTSGYFPHEVAQSARYFAARTGRYVFVSTVSVYDLKQPAVDEDSPTPALPAGETRYLVTGDSYGPLKAMCERIVESTMREKSTVVRPGLIVGPHDRTDRFTYWPLRFARGGEVLAPGVPAAPIQIVDVRDCADFIVRLVDRNRSGEYNVVSAPGTFAMDDVMTTCAHASRVPSSVSWVDDEFLLKRGVEPWTGLPLWLPPSLGLNGFMHVSTRKAQNAGLHIRPLSQTVRDTLAWALTLGRNRTRRAGITPQRETQLLQEWHDWKTSQSR